MKLKKLYELVVEFGCKMDPRGVKGVSKEIERLKASYKDFSERKKQEFDRERFDNPYADTRILVGKPQQEIKSILVGIDIEVGEIVLADRLRQKGRRIDLVMSHHPEGKALAGFYNVMHMQADILSKFGVPINVAEGVLEDRIKEVERKVMPANHDRAVDAARLLDIAYICAHTPADNGVATYLQGLLNKKVFDTVGDIIRLIEDIPEYKHAIQNNVVPKVVVGNGKRRPGKIFVDMTGGTEGSEKMFEILVQAGVGTIVGMHLSEKHIQEANKYNINIIIAGHIPSDTLGMNLLLDSLEKKQKLEIIPCSGFYRVKR